MDTTVSKIMYYDYRMEGKPQVIICSTEGDVKGFNMTANKNANKLMDDSA